MTGYETWIVNGSCAEAAEPLDDDEVSSNHKTPEQELNKCRERFDKYSN
jgi:hypothetical protein